MRNKYRKPDLSIRFFVQRQLPVLLALNAFIPTLPVLIVINNGNVFNGRIKYTYSEIIFILIHQSVSRMGYIPVISSVVQTTTEREIAVQNNVFLS